MHTQHHPHIHLCVHSTIHAYTLCVQNIIHASTLCIHNTVHTYILCVCSTVHAYTLCVHSIVQHWEGPCCSASVATLPSTLEAHTGHLTLQCHHLLEPSGLLSGGHPRRLSPIITFKNLALGFELPTNIHRLSVRSKMSLRRPCSLAGKRGSACTNPPSQMARGSGLQVGASSCLEAAHRGGFGRMVASHFHPLSHRTWPTHAHLFPSPRWPTFSPLLGPPWVQTLPYTCA